jgi:uncharacterized protein
MIMYFVLTFIVTWSLWFASGMASPAGLHRPWFLLGVFAPGLIGLGFTARDSGRSGVTTLLGRLVDWQVPARWYLFAISYMALIKLTAAVVYRAAWSAWPRFGDEPWLLLLAATLGSTFVGGQAGEELGWRGYALPRLEERFGLGAASVLLGVLWALWHLPLFFFPVGDTYRQSLPLYVLQVTALSVVMAWMYANTRRSLLPVMLLHAAVNNTKDIVPSADPGATNPWALSHSGVGWLTVGLLWLVASLCLVRMRDIPRLRGHTAEPAAT